MDTSHSDRARDRASRPSRAARVGIYAAFAAVALVALDVPLYNRVEPAFFGMPFFYWFQIAWVAVAAGATFAAYRLKV